MGALHSPRPLNHPGPSTTPAPQPPRLPNAPARTRLDLNGLRLLRDRLGDRCIAGFVLNLGELAYRKEDKIAIMPLRALWA